GGGSHARADRDSLGRVYRHHRARSVLVSHPYSHSALSPDRIIWDAHGGRKIAMLHDLFDGYTRSILVFTAVNIMAAYSFYVPFKTGQVSLGQAGFMAIGAYASAILTQKFGVPFAAALAVAGAVAGIIGVLVGFPALRIKGIYLLLLTLGFSEIVQVATLSWDFVGGAQGFRQIPFVPSVLEYGVVLIVVLVLFFARLERSSL